MTSEVSATTMPRRPNNTACRVAAIILDLAFGRDHACDALPATSVKAGTATVARVTRTTSVCIVVFRTLPVGAARFAWHRWETLFASPAIKLS
jgi:hypothetical protein